MQTGKSVPDRTLDGIALTGLGVWVVLVLSLHRIKVQAYDISTDAISYYAVGDFGYLMTLAFVGLGLAHVALAMRLHRFLRQWFAPSLLTLVGLCILASAVFEMDPKNTDPQTTHGLIHGLLGLFAFVVMALTPLVFAGSLRLSPGWSWMTRASLIFGVASVAAFLAMPLGFGDSYFGIG
jgi:Protein of unknown function (DUF998)